jgi:hypothetical protein
MNKLGHKNTVYLVGLHIHYRMIHGTKNIKLTLHIIKQRLNFNTKICVINMKTFALFHVSAAVKIRSSFFVELMQRRMIIADFSDLLEP